MLIQAASDKWGVDKSQLRAENGFVINPANNQRLSYGSLAEAAAKATLDTEELKNTNRLKIYVFGNDKQGQARAVAVFDNLGKGAAGAAVQN